MCFINDQNLQVIDVKDATHRTKKSKYQPKILVIYQRNANQRLKMQAFDKKIQVVD